MTIDPAAFARRYATGVAHVLEGLPAPDVAAMLDALEAAHVGDKQVFFIGNGGSAATASHWASDVTWGLVRQGIRPLRAIALTDNVPTMTAIANDASYDAIFATQLEVLAHPGDLLMAISASGNSPNIVRAVEAAKALGLVTVGVVGMTGGRVGELVKIRVLVGAADYGPIEDAHLVLDHLALAYLRVRLAK